MGAAFSGSSYMTPRLLLVKKSRQMPTYKGVWFLLSLAWQLRVNVQQYKKIKDEIHAPCCSAAVSGENISYSSQSPVPPKANQKRREVWHINDNTMETFSIITCPTQRIMPPHEEKLAFCSGNNHTYRCNDSWWHWFTNPFWIHS